jgi:threonine/homoserine/homoserine lactone efflux protein
MVASWSTVWSRIESTLLDLHLLALYIPFSLLLVITPGPDTVNVLSLSLSGGRQAGLRSIGGHACASFVHIGGAALGISSLIATSALAFDALKVFGAAYLLYIGLKGVLAKEHMPAIADSPAKEAFWQGFITHAGNPKVAIFFLTVLPQFLNPTLGHVWLQAIVLGLIHKGMALAWLTSWALAAGTAGTWMRSHTRFLLWLRRATGIVLVGFGLKLALTKRA